MYRHFGVYSLYLHGFTVFLCFARDDLVSAGGDSRSCHTWDSDMLVSLPPGVCEILEKMGVMAVLHGSVFDMALGYMAYCRSRDAIGCGVRCFGFSYDFSRSEVSNVRWRSTSSTQSGNEDGEPICDSNLPAISVFLTRIWLMLMASETETFPT